MPLWQRQEIQEVSWYGNAQGEFTGKRKDYSFRLSAFRTAWNFTLGSGSIEECFPPVTHRAALPGHHGSTT
jgi:hypothetical protein